MFVRPVGLQDPPNNSFPHRLPFSHSRRSVSPLNSALTQVLILRHLKFFRINTYTKTRGRATLRAPKFVNSLRPPVRHKPSTPASFSPSLSPILSGTCALSQKLYLPQALSNLCLAHSFAKHPGVGGCIAAGPSWPTPTCLLHASSFDFQTEHPAKDGHPERAERVGGSLFFSAAVHRAHRTPVGALATRILSIACALFSVATGEKITSPKPPNTIDAPGSHYSPLSRLYATLTEILGGFLAAD